MTEAEKNGGKEMRIRTGLKRTTTQMLNHSRRKAGLTTSRRSSLLSAARNQTPGLKNTRLGMLNANSIQSARLTRSNYQKLERSADSLVEQTKLLAERADAGGKPENLANTAANVVQHFNYTLDGLKQASGILNEYYRQAMKEIVVTNKSALAEIGIAVGADGSLSLDKEKFESADEEKLKGLLGSEGIFVKRVGIVASRVVDNAMASVESSSSRYNASGYLTNSYLSKYNYRG